MPAVALPTSQPGRPVRQRAARRRRASAGREPGRGCLPSLRREPQGAPRAAAARRRRATRPSRRVGADSRMEGAVQPPRPGDRVPHPRAAFGRDGRSHGPLPLRSQRINLRAGAGIRLGSTGDFLTAMARWHRGPSHSRCDCKHGLGPGGKIQAHARPQTAPAPAAPRWTI